MTGLGEQGLDLIQVLHLVAHCTLIVSYKYQAYVDRTADVQTASLLASYASAIAVAENAANDERINRWTARSLSFTISWSVCLLNECI